MSIDRAGFPFIGGAILVGLLLAAFGFYGTAIVPLVLAAFFVFFFRDPDRPAVHAPGEVISPADGRVLVAGPAESAGAPVGTWQQVSIFLSPMDVHVNRVPIGGRVTRVLETPGRFLPAYRPDGIMKFGSRMDIYLPPDATIAVHVGDRVLSGVTRIARLGSERSGA
jgi:phosphatidylserine decarboxylase